MSIAQDQQHAKAFAPRKRRRWWLAIAALVLLFAVPPAALWWLSRDRLKDEVLAIGGRYESISDTGMAVAVRYITRGENPRVHCRIDLGNSRADDAWLENQADDLRRPNQLVLFLRESHVTSRGLAALSDVQSLVYLDLSGTRLEDAAVDTLAKFPRLVQLYLPHTGISDSALARFAAAPHLVFLCVDAGQATDVGIAGLMTCPRLRSLWIVDADNECVTRVARFHALTGLDLQGDKINADSLPVLKEMRSLKSLTLIDTQFSDAELSELRQALPGCTITRMTSSKIEAQREASWNRTR